LGIIPSSQKQEKQKQKRQKATQDGHQVHEISHQEDYSLPRYQENSNKTRKSRPSPLVVLDVKPRKIQTVFVCNKRQKVLEDCLVQNRGI
jgi:hypothetical protein